MGPPGMAMLYYYELLGVPSSFLAVLLTMLDPLLFWNDKVVGEC